MQESCNVGAGKKLLVNRNLEELNSAARPFSLDRLARYPLLMKYPSQEEVTQAGTDTAGSSQPSNVHGAGP